MLRFVVDAVRAEEFNSSTLFLFGSYTIGKERLFLEAARILQQKVLVFLVLHACSLPEIADDIEYQGITHDSFATIQGS